MPAPEDKEGREQWENQQDFWNMKEREARLDGAKGANQKF